MARSVALTRAGTIDLRVEDLAVVSRKLRVILLGPQSFDGADNACACEVMVVSNALSA